jgi:hypothetical protein
LIVLVALAACVKPVKPAEQRNLTHAEIDAIPTTFPTALGDTQLQAVSAALHRENIVENVGKLASILLDLRRFEIPIDVRECGEPNAFYDPSTSRIVFCYDLIAAANELAGRPRDSYDSHARAVVIFAVLHEMAHALLHRLRLQPYVNEEDVADDFALLMMTNVDVDAARRLVDAPSQFFFAHEHAYQANANSVHSSDDDRARKALCILWGRHHDPELGARMSAAARENCDNYTRAIVDAWNRALAPYCRVESGRTF